MAIKGLSDRVRLPRLGRIRLGIKVDGNKSSYPKAVDYFVCPPEVQAVYGDKPRDLPIMFPTEDPEQWASQFYRCYSQTRGLICKGDGEVAMALVDTSTGEIAGKDAKATELREVTCNPDECDKMQSKACRAVMNLQFLLPDVPGLGIWQLDTSSFNSIRNINSAVKLIQGMCGRISMMPLILRVVQMEAQADGKKKNIYVLTLTTPHTMREVLTKLQELPVGRALLPEPDMEPPDDLFPDEVIADETPVEQAASVPVPAEPQKPPKQAPAKAQGGAGGQAEGRPFKATDREKQEFFKWADAEHGMNPLGVMEVLTKYAVKRIVGLSDWLKIYPLDKAKEVITAEMAGPEQPSADDGQGALEI